jgi:predicted N-acetyltransferase YhbS
VTSLTLRALTPADAAPLAHLAQRAGRNVHESEFARFLALEGAAGLVVERDGATVGAITHMRYFEHGFLGPVVVEKGSDSTGVSLHLVGRALETLLRTGAAYVEVEASPDEAHLLRPLGFTTLRRTLVMERPAHERSPTGRTVPMASRHLLDLGILDASAVGFGRKEYVVALARDLPEAARALEHDGDVEGYVVARRAKRGHLVGPLVTRDASVASATTLLEDAVAPLSASSIVALVPEPSALLPELDRFGFAQVGTLERMRAGKPPEPGSGPSATGWLLGSRITG